MTDIAIRVDNLGKRYRLGRGERYRTLRESITQMAGSPWRWLRNRQSSPHQQGNLWALRDLSFDVHQGDIIGIIGRNGAGKSTLLKILSRITEPTIGEVTVFGRVGSLLEVGTGFHPELTGRENIFLNGSILGMKRAEIARSFDEIVAFAEVERFIDTPVKHYSSGMYMRLAFAVAAHLETEILLIDEVLAVGDSGFQARCLGKMKGIAAAGRTILFVSHNLAAIRTLCTRALLLSGGAAIGEGSVDHCLEKYTGLLKVAQGSSWTRTDSATKPLAIQSVKATLEGTQPAHRLRLEVELRTQSWHKPAFMAVDIADLAGTPVMQSLPTVTGFLDASQHCHRVELKVALPPLIPGKYTLGIWAGSHNNETLDEIRECAGFEITASPTPNRVFPHTADHGFIVPPTTIRYLTT